MTSEIVFAAYRPHVGKAQKAENLLRSHVPLLQKLEFATARAPIVVRAKDGTIIEIFEWSSAEAPQKAHEHPEVAEVWESMAQVCDFVSLKDQEEFKRAFAHFAPIL